MKILIVGSGGREYSIGLAINKEKNSHEIFYAPGNGATDKFATNIDIKDYHALASWAKDNNIDLTIVGPEQPLVDGIVDIFKAQNLTIFGPTANAARLEGSKIYMKNFLTKYNIPTAKYIQTDSLDEASDFINSLSSTPIVVKADGLCGGKGVIIASSKDEAIKASKDMLDGSSFGEAGMKIIVEEFLDGYELSMFAICDGDNFKLLPAAQDHKRLLDNDKGPNTGGMGAYAPTPLVDDKLYQKVKSKIIKPTLEGMKKEGSSFEGVLFIGLMIVNNEPIVLEYNVRFGDPECEILMPLMDFDVSELFYKGATSQLNTLDIKFKDKYAVGIVIASKDYPYKSSIPSEIIVDKIIHDDLIGNTHIVYAGVQKEDDKMFATGGRVLLSVGLGDSIKKARDRAYMLAAQIHFAGKQYRGDIAYQALEV